MHSLLLAATFHEDALKLRCAATRFHQVAEHLIQSAASGLNVDPAAAFNPAAASKSCRAFNTTAAAETGLDVHSWLLFSLPPDLDLADSEASQCRNARKALRSLPARLNIKDTERQVSQLKVGEPVVSVTLEQIEKLLSLHQDGPDVC